MVVPTDWKEVRLSEIADVDPENLSSATSPYYQFKYISLENVSKGRLVGFSEQVFHAAPSRARRILKDLDVLLATVRPNLLGHFLFRGRNNWVGSTGFAVVRCRPDLYSPTFMSQLVFSHVIQAQIELLITGSNYPAINSKDVRELRIPLPPLREQEVIAEALSDADAAIESLDALIAKKRDVKQATMQQYAQAERVGTNARMVALGTVAVINKGELITSSTSGEGPYPVIAGGKSPAYFSSRFNRDGLTITISASGANAGYVALRKGKIWASDCSTISEDSSIDMYYLAAQLEVRQEKIYKAQFGGAQPHIRPNDLAPLEICYVPLVQQQEIGRALRAMDDELEALTEQVSKLRMVKEGMMQDLLTGKVRLV